MCSDRIIDRVESSQWQSCSDGRGQDVRREYYIKWKGTVSRMHFTLLIWDRRGPDTDTRDGEVDDSDEETRVRCSRRVQLTHTAPRLSPHRPATSQTHAVSIANIVSQFQHSLATRHNYSQSSISHLPSRKVCCQHPAPWRQEHFSPFTTSQN